MAPEVAGGRPATAASDVYALGAVLYELLAGVPPRRVESLADLGDDRPLPPLAERVPDAPPALAAAITRCLDREPLRRPQSAGDLALELDEHGGAPTRPLRSPVRVQRTRPTRRIWIAFAGAAALVGVALALALGLRDDPPSAPPPLEPVPAGSSPAEDARSLAEWLRANSG
jgi:serine/threonine protein kinase